MNKKDEYVYVMVSTFNLTKIGVSCTPEQRCEQLQNASGVPITIAATYNCNTSGYAVEKQLHKHFQKKRAIGEWFALDEEDRKCISELVTEFLAKDIRRKEACILQNDQALNKYEKEVGIRLPYSTDARKQQMVHMLKTATYHTVKDIADAVGVSRRTILNWKKELGI